MDSRSCWFVARTNRSMVAIGPVIALFTPICLFHSSTLEPMASMSRITRSVKGKRSYDASQRRQKARRSLDRIIEMAQRRFLRDSYGPTTISAITEDAGVSVDTIDNSFCGKPALIRAMGARALVCRHPVPADQRCGELQARERPAGRH